MKIEKKFYTEEAALWRMVEKEIEEETSHMSEPQKARARFANSQEARYIEDKVDALQRSQYHVVDPDKMKRFKALSEAALMVAEAAPMDIIIDTDNFIGRISMTADCFMILPSSPEGMQGAVGKLFEEAETVTVIQKNAGFIEMYFTYPLCTDIVKGNEGEE